MTVSVFAPVSIGNLSVGFDTLGLALAPVDDSLLGDTVSVQTLTHEQTQTNVRNQFELTGTHAHTLSRNKQDNIAWQCLLAFEAALREHELPLKPVKLTLHKNIPVSSGLGSSACSVVATLAALNEFYQNPLNDTKLLALMGKLEAKISGSLHYDNVAPSFLGGLQLMLNHGNKVTQSLPFFDDCFWLIAYPDVVVSTKAAREILPQNYPRETLIEFGQNLAGFVDACHRQDKSTAFALIKDVVAEPYRAKLLPNFENARNVMLDLGALCVGISGSGPTLFCAVNDLTRAQNCQTWLQQNYLQSELGFVQICKIDTQGTRRVELLD